ncbi:glutamine--fructose-6-phosphate aminotransferase [Candidatus Uhrbacteria bacterium RIFCSPHIGHO2_12_FULL_54_23]|uniref:Glutamine--fructose-6-phosphate aminotransferase [isomerizing] n=2 Tax=Candidatus Uhriibacteriota TaxID=1752732 RepID=A0A1F7UKL3_9BACT|nr:MAG: glutamine--fructose-6-phosphate aminotransferase [Candidatus Uhrbacteria bacterium RIFCSPHIGHO2_12_FULL_54_23]OGL90308.1 MAG: glutamine--fructose-6-phosphate aminotransferase [Candidatus Uhrbacteria bacterium RIFCSPLOWO2_02_FULL_54_37]
MCGIIGYLGKKEALPIIMEGLKRMEYRGYDSAGVSILENGGMFAEKRAGKLSMLEEALDGRTAHPGTVGIGHIRWATHGAPSDVNAHPHYDCAREIHVAHNGIIENYQSLRDELKAQGHTFVSDTDTEVFAHLIERVYADGVPLEVAVQKALRQVVGAYGLAVVAKREPEKIVAARLGSPLVLGVVPDGSFLVASDVAAMIAQTRDVVYVQDRELVILTPKGYAIRTLDAEQVERGTERVEWDMQQVEKGGHAHFMLKEILEQPAAVRASTRGRIIMDEGLVKLGGLQGIDERVRAIDRIVVAACGSARHAGMVGEYLIEEYADIPVEVELASEFRYRSFPASKRTAVLAISQSGETADTLAALKEAKRRGMLALGIVNTVGSSIARETDAGMYNHVGPEIAVATTKAFTSQVVLLTLLAVFLGRQRRLSHSTSAELLSGLLALPDQLHTIVDRADEIIALGKQYSTASRMLFMGRKYQYPIALEGALKLKEISYVQAEGFAAGEMKHGPIALVDEETPTVVIAPKDSVYEKTLSNIEEVKARGGRVIAVATEGDTQIKRIADDVLYVPAAPEPLMPALTIMPLQLFAYGFAVARGVDVDRPRNLAKSVTVE